jgi:chromosome segregation ATPase
MPTSLIVQQRLSPAPTLAVERAASAPELWLALLAGSTVLLSLWLGFDLWTSRIQLAATQQERQQAWTLTDAVLADMAQWRSRADSMENDRALLLKRLKTASEYLATLHGDKTQLTQENAATRAAFETSQKQWNSYGNAIEATLGSTQQALLKTSQSAAEQEQQAMGKIRSLDSRVSELSNANSQLAKEADHFAKQADQLTHQSQRLSGEVRDLQCRNQQLSSSVSSLEGANSCLRAEVCRLESRISSLESENCRPRSEGSRDRGR